MRTPLSADNRGFTLMEVIVVMILMAIFAMLAVSRQPQTDMSLRASAEVLKSHLRYTQMRAMSTDSSWGVEYGGSPPTYWLFRQSDNRRIILPGESQSYVDFSSNGVTITPANFRLTFDQRGRPDTTRSNLSFISRQAILTLSKAGESQPIIILQNTGFIQ
jgi:prepilin-type N-terminal cleavage/methylation domain-containing protein